MTVDPLVLLDSLVDPFVFCDTEHVVRYMNRVARDKHGDELIGQSVLDCHSLASRAQMLRIAEQMADGLDEVRITDDHRFRVYMRAVRSADGQLLGYYERYEPPVGQEDRD